jgi:hypothetical protein
MQHFDWIVNMWNWQQLHNPIQMFSKRIHSCERDIGWSRTSMGKFRDFCLPWEFFAQRLPLRHNIHDFLVVEHTSGANKLIATQGRSIVNFCAWGCSVSFFWMVATAASHSGFAMAASMIFGVLIDEFQV